MVTDINIDQPFVDHWNWRQSDVAMIAENFYSNGFNIFYPQINWAGDPGYIGTEFPLQPFLASLLYLLFGVQEWIGRSISVASYALSVPFLYLIVKKNADARSGLFAILIYTLAPLGIFASRSFMPDMPTLSLSIVGMYLFTEWLDRGGLNLFIWMSVATSLAILVKLPSVIIGLPLLYLAWQKYGISFLRRRDLWTFAALSLIPAMAWYWHAQVISTSTLVMGGVHPHFFGAGGLAIVSFQTYLGILKRIVTWQLTPIVTTAMLCGIFLPSRGKHGRLVHWWLVGIILFIFFAGAGHHRHAWYQLPMVPVAAAFAGFAFNLAFERVPKRGLSRLAGLGMWITLAFVLSYLGFVYTKDRYEPWATPHMKAGIAVDHIAPSNALIVVAGGGDPTTFYYGRRKGWHFVPPTDSERAIHRLEEFRGRGATYLVLRSDEFWWLDFYRGFSEYLDSKYRRAAGTDEYVIFDLSTANTQ